MDNDDVVSALNTLVETSKDGEQGFRTCADNAKNPQHKQFFEQAARRCAEGAAELQAKVRHLGGDPERSGSMTGALHRSWVNIKSTITGMDEAAVLAECERGEDSAKQVYEEALKKDLPADVRAMVERQYREVKQNHDRVRAMRNTAAP
ncbi:MAG: PA2169 family four-helix-bundle protein [Alphaproteobacteria bacterium]|nr:PA2169 family four-helix-bundle protein [Alphaproteobacteria bacterium]